MDEWDKAAQLGMRATKAELGSESKSKSKSKAKALKIFVDAKNKQLSKDVSRKRTASAISAGGYYPTKSIEQLSFPERAPERPATSQLVAELRHQPKKSSDDELARKHLGDAFSSLKTVGSDREDFREGHIESVHDMLREASGGKLTLNALRALAKRHLGIDHEAKARQGGSSAEFADLSKAGIAAAISEAKAAAKDTQTGARGGRYYVSASGTKVYVKR